VPRAQKGRAGITDLEKVAETINQKAIQKGQRKIRRILREL